MKKLASISLLFLLFVITSCNDQKKDTQSNVQVYAQTNPVEQKIMETTKQIFKAWNDGDTNLVKANTVEKFEHYSNGVLTSGDQSGFAGLIKFFKTAYPDLNFTYDIVVVKGNKTYVKWTGKGNNTGMSGTKPPTGKAMVFNGFSIYTFNEEGKATQEDGYFDQP